MKKLSITMLCIVFLLMVTVSYANAESEIIDMTIVQSVGMNSSEWMGDSGFRSLLAAGVNMCLEFAHAWDSWSSGPNIDGAYVGKDGARMAVAIPTYDQKHCIVVVFTPTETYGMYALYNGDFRDYNVAKGISAMCDWYEKTNAEDNKYVAELLGR